MPPRKVVTYMKTYDEILAGMYEKYEERMGTSPDDASDIGIRMKVLAGEIYDAQTNAEWIKTQMFPQTAVGEYLDMHAQQRGLTRKSGTKAYGDVTFYVSEVVSYDIEIPQGTVCAAMGTEAVRFATVEDVTLRAGNQGATCDVQAVTEGADGNVAVGEITVLVTPIAGISSIKNEFMLTGGSDEETDEELRARLIESFINVPNGTNKAYYIQSAMQVEGVSAVGVVPRERGPGTVNVYIMTSTGTVSDDLISEVQEYLDSLREINVDIEVGVLNLIALDVYAEIEVVNGYDADKVFSDCDTAVREYFSLLNAGENVYLSDISEYIQHVDGVKNFSFVRSVINDTEIADDSVATAGTLTFTERT